MNPTTETTMSLTKIEEAGRRAMADMYAQRFPTPEGAPAAVAPGYQWVQATEEEWTELRALRERRARRVPEPGYDMGRGWAVTVSRDGHGLLTIADEYLQGTVLTEDVESLVLGCIRHLQAFIGDEQRRQVEVMSQALNEIGATIGASNGTRYEKLPVLAKQRIGKRRRKATDEMVAYVHTMLPGDASTMAPQWLKLLWTLMWDAAAVQPVAQQEGEPS